MYMEDARTKFTQLIGKDFRAAIRQTIPCICPSCDAQLAVTQQQVEMVKTQMQEFSCPNCGGVVPFTQPSLHEQLQAAINAESGIPPPDAATAAEDDDEGLGRIESITLTGSGSGSGPARPRPQAQPSAGDGMQSGFLLKHESAPSPEPAPAVATGAGAGKLAGGTSPHEQFARRQLSLGESGRAEQAAGDEPDSEFDVALRKLRAEFRGGAAVVDGRLLQDEGSAAAAGGGADLTRSRSTGAAPSGPLQLAEDAASDAATIPRLGALVAELSGPEYGFEKGAVGRAIRRADGDLFAALDVLEAARPGADEGALARSKTVLSWDEATQTPVAG